ncbi:MAG: 2-C-methyl-D-erythritol 4-phosphate cytidylyltransferase [Clostridia bacterium]|nr:2-C-methyl-D-erythritol 4-phosphate cytidylyltransferase [Clostridia bacterium]
MNVGMILAGGRGTRLGANVPKQFIEVLGKPVLAYTLEIFENDKEIDAIQIVCQEDQIKDIEDICEMYKITKTKWICVGGKSFLESVRIAADDLRLKLKEELLDEVLKNPTEENRQKLLDPKTVDDTIVVVSFGVSPLTPEEDINDSIRVAKLHGNAFAAQTIDLSTGIVDDQPATHTTQNIYRESLRGFANPWTFNLGELCEAYAEGERRGILNGMEPHTSTLYFLLGKPIWFSKSTSPQCKITYKYDLEIFEGILLYREKHKNDKKETDDQ